MSFWIDVVASALGTVTAIAVLNTYARWKAAKKERALRERIRVDAEEWMEALFGHGQKPIARAPRDVGRDGYGSN